MKKIINKNTAFSLVEIMIGIMIVSLIMIAGFSTLSAVGIGKIKLIEQTEIAKQSYFVAEKFFEMVKKGGTIDYEEYWNIKNSNPSYTSGHIAEPRGYGNFGKSGVVGSTTYGNTPYYCISELSTEYDADTTGGCIGGSFNISSNASDPGSQINQQQRYGQYGLQFIDYNSDQDSDSGDEDASGELYFAFIGDDDDLYIGDGPESFSGTQVQELYLISPNGRERTFFRLSVGLDPDAPSGATCTGTQVMTGTGCLGTIEFLKLVGYDYGFDHVSGTIDSDGSENDGIIDTWIIHPDFHAATSQIIAGSNTNSYWKKILPDTQNVSNFDLALYPNKSLVYAWKESDDIYQVAPYVQIKMTLSPSWKQKRKITGNTPSIDFITTISLTDLDFR